MEYLRIFGNKNSRINQEKEKSFEDAQLSERFERKTFESESFLIKKNKPKESNNASNDSINTYKPRFKPKTLTVKLNRIITIFFLDISKFWFK